MTQEECHPISESPPFLSMQRQSLPHLKVKIPASRTNETEPVTSKARDSVRVREAYRDFESILRPSVVSTACRDADGLTRLYWRLRLGSPTIV
jgi:hypothetical protein